MRNPNTTDGSEVSDGEMELELRMQERDRIAEEKRWRQIALLLHTEMKCIGLPHEPETPERDYDLGGDEWICSRCGVDTWHRDCGCCSSGAA